MSFRSLSRAQVCHLSITTKHHHIRSQQKLCKDVFRFTPSASNSLKSTTTGSHILTGKRSGSSYDALCTRRFATKARLEPNSGISERNWRLIAAVRRLADERKTLLSELETHYDSPEQQKRMGKRVGELEAVSTAWEAFEAKQKALEEATSLLKDPDPSMSSMAAEECASLQLAIQQTIEDTFPALVVPPSPTATLSAVLELKAGVGGQEACLFLSDLHRMYMRYANECGWSTKVLSVDNADGATVGGIMVEVQGEGAYDELRWESGVHRIQRVPATEAAGRVHTSTVTVAVFPLPVEKGAEEAPLYDMKDLKVEFMRARGAGGQHVNKTESAVRLTHLPTGITVAIQDERSQHMNKAKAFRILEARLLHRKVTTEAEEHRSSRRQLFKSANRNEKIRTYNAPQDRVTDHRISLTLTGLSSMLDGCELQHFINALKRQHQQNQLVELHIHEDN